MTSRSGLILIAVALLILATPVLGQQEEMCADRGIIPNMDIPVRRFNVVFGRISIKRPKGEKPPNVVVWLREGRSTQRLAFDGSGSYCFEKSTQGGEITVDINGQQADRRPIITNAPEQREDFDFNLTSNQPSVRPGVISAKFVYQRNEKNAKLFEKALSSSRENKTDKAIEHLTALIKTDPADFIAAATLASIHYRQKNYPEAEIWFARSVQVNPEFSPAWLSLAQSQYGQKKYAETIESCQRLIKLEPTSAMGFYILGETYLRIEKGNQAVEALNNAIKHDPVGMAECHIILADLYDMNGLKKLATKEYKAFLTKIPNHSDKKRIEKYIADNPE